MDSSSLQERSAEFEIIEAALAGDNEAASKIRSSERHRRLLSNLIKRGATLSEAEDIVADLWADCFNCADSRKSLLEKFSGKGSLDAFLARTALNRLIDAKRRLRFRGQLLGKTGGSTQHSDPFDQLPAADQEEMEDSVVKLLRDALYQAMAKCDPEKLFAVRLVSLQGIDQGTAGKMLGWSQSKISRAMKATMDEIRVATLANLQQSDPWLELKWEDFVNLCAESNHLFGELS